MQKEGKCREGMGLRLAGTRAVVVSGDSGGGGTLPSQLAIVSGLVLETMNTFGTTFKQHSFEY